MKDAHYGALEVLLKRAQAAGAVRGDIGIDDLKIALSGTCLGIGYANADGATRDYGIGNPAELQARARTED